MNIDDEFRLILRPGHGVVHERRGQELACLAVIDDLFHEGLSQALRDPAMHLPVHDGRVDDDAAVIHRDIPFDCHDSCIRIDLDLTDVATVWKILLRGVELLLTVQAVGHAVGRDRPHAPGQFE